jgi:hypothetical protein
MIVTVPEYYVLPKTPEIIIVLLEFVKVQVDDEPDAVTVHLGTVV